MAISQGRNSTSKGGAGRSHPRFLLPSPLCSMATIFWEGKGAAAAAVIYGIAAAAEAAAAFTAAARRPPPAIGAAVQGSTFPQPSLPLQDQVLRPLQYSY